MHKKSRQTANGRKNTANTVLSWVINICICVCIILVIALLIKDGVFGNFSFGEPIGGSSGSNDIFDGTFVTAAVSETPFVESPPETRIVSLTPMTTVTTTPAPTETTAETPSETVSGAAFPEATGEYNKEFFDNYLFIGDSISTGLYNYDFLSISNVFAKIGLTPVSVRTEDVNGTTVYQKMTVLSPDTICIMLGTNGLSYLDIGSMIESYGLFIDEIKDTLPDADIIVMAIPPVTKAHEDSKPENLTIINEFNADLKNLADDKNITYFDVYTLLADDDGYMRADYAEKDGLHLQGAAYKRILFQLESDAKS